MIYYKLNIAWKPSLFDSTETQNIIRFLNDKFNTNDIETVLTTDIVRLITLIKEAGDSFPYFKHQILSIQLYMITDIIDLMPAIKG